MENIKLLDLNVIQTLVTLNSQIGHKKRKYENLDQEETDDEEQEHVRNDANRAKITESVIIKCERKVFFFLPNTVPSVDIAFLPSRDLIKGYSLLNEKNAKKPHYFLIPEPLVSLDRHEVIDCVTFYPKESELAVSVDKPRFLVLKLQPVLPVRKLIPHL